MKNTLIAVIVLVLIGFGLYFLTKNVPTPAPVEGDLPTATTTATSSAQLRTDKEQTVIGRSVEGRDIIAYNFGSGNTSLVFVGGIHGGYEWNTSLLAWELMDYLKANPSTIPANLKVSIIPVLNPDGLFKVAGTAGRFAASDISSSQDTVVSGRFNANNVDLSRNFDCDWQATGVWQNKPVSGGTAAFSEPESLAFKNFVEAVRPSAVVAWYSAAGGVFSSSCGGDILPETTTLTNTYAKAAGYPAYEEFDFYTVTGDLVNWLAKEDIPATSVLLTTHRDTEKAKNLAGVKAVLAKYAK